MKRRGVKDTDPYDWEKLDQTANANLANIAGNLHINIHGIHDQVYGNNVPSPMTAATAGSNASGTEFVSSAVLDSLIFSHNYETCTALPLYNLFLCVHVSFSPCHLFHQFIQ